MTKETIALSHCELDRLAIIQSVAARELTQRQAALRLGLSIRQLKRLVCRYRAQGPPGLVSGHRGKRANNAIDDATGRLLALRFAPTEAYMATLRSDLDTHARPVALYCDKHSIFRVNAADREGELTQFTRALTTLDIEPIHAHTPQAKGRVERANQTLQDQLVKEMRLAGIDDIDTANAWLPTFLESYNAQFAKAPQQAGDAHRAVLHDAAELDQILSHQHARKLSKNLACQFQGREYQITDHGNGHRLRGAAVTVCAAFDGSITLLREGRVLPHRLLAEGQTPIPLDDEKTVQDRQRITPGARGLSRHPRNPPDTTLHIHKGTLLLGPEGDISALG